MTSKNVPLLYKRSIFRRATVNLQLLTAEFASPEVILYLFNVLQTNPGITNASTIKRKPRFMSSMELEQLEKCMDHLAYIIDRLGITEANFKEGKASLSHDGVPANPVLMKSLCTHIEALYKDELVSGEDALDPDFYFSQ